ncbi:hypothetical protein LTR85_007200 [Meristemomyces frigidus]|nr:hypothetical protein LTR85_007200 [Meristemomyces frigidus]
MDMLRFIAAALLALSTACASAQSECLSAPYGSLLCLAGDAAASSLCSAATRTVTGSLTTKATAWATPMARVDALAQGMLAQMSLETTTVTVTSTPSRTVFDFATMTDSYSTTYVASPTGATVRRNRIQQIGGAAANAPTCIATAALSAVRLLPLDALATACSCIGNPVSSVTATQAGEEVPATTLLVERDIKYTETVTLPAPTISLNATTSATTAFNLDLKVPTFTQVFGPTAGCEDIAKGPAQQLDTSITDVQDAIQQCKDACTQISSCAFVYVQHLFTDWGNTTPHFECWFGDHHLDAAADLECGLEVGVWGVANGFDAYGRG